jgi:DNA-binding beta-propeller fold protein YncE
MRSILPVGTFHRTIALTYDGKHVWVANKMSNNVMKFLAKDGSLVDTIGVGQQHEALAFDGKDIWVANGGDNTITKLRVSDGASCTFKVGQSPPVFFTKAPVCG